MALNLPRLPQTEPTYPQMQVWMEEFAEAIELAVNNIQDTVDAIQAAMDAADAANAAAVAADASAAAAQQTADDITNSNALGESYVSGVTMTAADVGADATITISAHARHYPQPDGSTDDVAVTGGTVTGLAFDTLFYVYYDDPTRAGGAVTYLATTTDATAAQLGDRHTVGAIRTPLNGAADTGGATTRPPGTRAVDLSTL